MKSTMLIVSTNLHFFESMFAFFSEQYQMELAQDELSGIKKTTDQNPEVIIIDYTIPRLGGVEMCIQLRQMTNVPIFIIGDGLSSEQRIRCFEVGADDIITLQTDPMEIYYRLQVLKRKTNSWSNPSDGHDILLLGNLIMNRALNKAYIDGEELVLTRKEFALLWVMVENHDQVVRRKDLVRVIWGYDEIGDDRMVDTHLNRLRKKLQSKECDLQITTIWGVGYKLERASKDVVL